MHGQKNIKLYNAELRLEGKQELFYRQNGQAKKSCPTARK